MLTCLNSGLLLSNKQDLPALKWLSSMSREQRDLGSYLFLLSVSMQGQWSPLGANGSWGLAMIGGLIQLGLAMVGGSPLEDQQEKLWFIFPRILVFWVTGLRALVPGWPVARSHLQWLITGTSPAWQ